jgi:hypothetical protein
LSSRSREKRLELYTLKRPEEVLRILIAENSYFNEIIIFKGFSSYLTQETPSNPDVLLIPENAIVVEIDRIKSPYSPNNPNYIQKGLSWALMEELFQHVEV